MTSKKLQHHPKRLFQSLLMLLGFALSALMPCAATATTEKIYTKNDVKLDELPDNLDDFSVYNALPEEEENNIPLPVPENNLTQDTSKLSIITGQPVHHGPIGNGFSLIEDPVNPQSFDAPLLNETNTTSNKKTLFYNTSEKQQQTDGNSYNITTTVKVIGVVAAVLGLSYYWWYKNTKQSRNQAPQQHGKHVYD